MEQEVLHLLEGTTSALEGTRKSAELTILHLYNNADFPFALLSISTHTDIATYLRQAALLSLNRMSRLRGHPSSTRTSRVLSYSPTRPRQVFAPRSLTFARVTVLPEPMTGK